MNYKGHIWWFVNADLPFVGEDGRVYINQDTGEIAVGDGVTTFASLPKVTGGVSAHSGLSGLAADDHPQYATDTDLTTHAGAADPHTGYRLESADHDHSATGAQAGTLTAAALPDRTRSLYLPSKALDSSTGFSAQLGTQPDEVHSWRLDDAADGSLFATFLVPQDWVSGALTLRAHLSMVSTSATPSVRMSAGYLELTGASPTGARTIVGPSTVVLTSTANMQTTDFTLGTPGAAGRLWGIYLRRFGANAADTYAQNMRVLGIEIRYTADS